MKPFLVPGAVLACAGLFSSGCTTTRSAAAAGVKEADDQLVAGCAFLKSIVEQANGLGPRSEIENAKTKVLEQAAKVGATHIVWQSLASDVSGATALGRAYRCPGLSR
jgi:hypothetical protein